jgi:hypothetical protein
MVRQREERWRGEVTNELRHIAAHLLSLDDQMKRLDARVEQLFARHLDYHEQNEHRWGFMRWAQRYPWRFAALVTAAVLCVRGVDTSLMPLIRELFTSLVR